MAPEMLQKGIKGFIGNPVFNITADLLKNRDFKDQPIIPLESTKAEATHAAFSYIYRQLAPSIAPAIPPFTKDPFIKGGYSWDKVAAALEKRPDFSERTRGLTPALLDTLVGLKITLWM